MVTTQQGKNFVHELLMEYIRQNNVLKCGKDMLPERIAQIAKLENIISKSIEKEYHNFSFL